MRILWPIELYAVCAKTSGQTIRQLTNFPLLITAGKPAFFRSHRLQDSCREADQVEPEPGIEWIGKAIEFFPEQSFDNRRIADRFAGFDRNAPHLAIGAEK